MATRILHIFCSVLFTVLLMGFTQAQTRHDPITPYASLYQQQSSSKQKASPQKKVQQKPQQQAPTKAPANSCACPSSSKKSAPSLQTKSSRKS